MDSSPREQPQKPVMYPAGAHSTSTNADDILNNFDPLGSGTGAELIPTNAIAPGKAQLGLPASIIAAYAAKDTLDTQPINVVNEKELMRAIEEDANKMRAGRQLRSQDDT